MIQTKKDRVGEVYEGTYAGNALQKRTRDRVDWICAHTTGEQVLDIGCSQGIVALLLARAGKQVLAIDIDPESISYAQRRAMEEPLSVQQRVHYLCADFLGQDLDGASFDSILVTEVLEHLEDPNACLEKIAGLLRPDGRVVVMVPFGINAHPDHKRTYYYLDLLHSVDHYFQPVSADFVGGWVVICAYSRQGLQRETIPFDETLVQKMERGFSDVDSRKQILIDSLRTKLNKVTEKERAISEKYESLSSTYQALDAQYESLTGEYKGLTDEHQALNGKHGALTSEYRMLSGRYEKLAVENQELSGRCETLSNEQTVLSGKLERLSNGYQTLSSQHQALTSKYNTLLKKHKILSKKHEDLSNSKLGRLQLKWWQRQGKRRRANAFRHERWKTRIRTFVYNHSFLTKLYITLRYGGSASAKPNSVKALPVGDTLAKLKPDKTQAFPFQVPDWAYVPQAEFEAKTDWDFFRRIKPLLETLPQSNGCRYYQRSRTKIGIVADIFFFDSIHDAAEFVFLMPDQWEEQIQEIDVLLMVSTWSGLNEEWRGAAIANSAKQQCIFKIIAACRDRQIPTIFYSKEDPGNYERFLPIAQHSDVIFTGCAEFVEAYQKDCGNQRVYMLPFGINPLFHNPVGMRNPHKQPGVIFSGTWMNRYSDRCKDMRLLLDGVLAAGVPLKIIDRAYHSAPTSYRYPPAYWSSISPAIAHDDLQKLHKLYDWALDINTVKTSMTMFANRGYELQASGSLQISNYSVGVNEKLPFVFIANEQHEVVEILKKMPPEEIYRRQIDGVRAMMTGETCFDRVGVLMAAVGIQAEQPLRRIAVVADVDSPRVHEMFDRQTYREKTLLFAGSVTAEELETYDMVAFFAEEMDYEIFYLEDMANGFKYTACNYITKDAFWSGDTLYAGTEHDYVTRMASKYRTLFWREAFQPGALLTMNGQQEMPNGYSIDSFNYNAQKPQDAPMPEGLLLSVIVPVYNNWRPLLGKCFTSLQRSSMFDNMHIILVDDGSTDGETPNVVRYLERTYPNVTSYFFDDGGSGSASRPRNKGVELADTEYLTFLDPDNEAVNDGYAVMYALLKEAPEGEPYDLVLADRIKCTDKMTYGRYYQSLGCKNWEHSEYRGDMRQLLMETKMLAANIQASLIRKELLVNNHLEQVPGAAGQDTLFGWEIMIHARFIRGVAVQTHVYYALVNNSTTNSIGKRYFEKCRMIEGPRRKFLQDHDLLQFYAERRYNRYFPGWVLDHLCRAKPEDEEECARIVYEMHQMYQDCYNGKSRIINEFAKYCGNGEYGKALETIRKARQEERLK